MATRHCLPPRTNIAIPATLGPRVLPGGRQGSCTLPRRILPVETDAPTSSPRRRRLDGRSTSWPRRRRLDGRSTSRARRRRDPSRRKLHVVAGATRLRDDARRPAGPLPRQRLHGGGHRGDPGRRAPGYPPGRPPPGEPENPLPGQTPREIPPGRTPGRSPGKNYFLFKELENSTPPGIPSG